MQEGPEGIEEQAPGKGEGREERLGENVEGGGGRGTETGGRETDGDSEEGSLSAESADSQGRVGEKREQRTYWKEIEKKVERGCSESLEDAHRARYALYEKQVRDLGNIVEPTSSEGEEEGPEAERRRERRREREKEMSAKRAQKERLHREYLKSKRNIVLDRRVVWEMRRKLEEQWEGKRQAKLIAKKLRAKQRREERRAKEAQEARRHQAAKKRKRQEGTERREDDGKRRSGKERAGEREGQQEEQTPAGRKREGIQTRSTSRSTWGAPEETADASIILASERGLPAEGEIFAHFTRLLGVTTTTGADCDIEVTPAGSEQPLFIRGYKLTLPAGCLQEEALEGPLADNEMQTERWGGWQIA
eukprot:4562054-Pleurochrysis_carterae.AAC.4